jgi:hypothetical protein
MKTRNFYVHVDSIIEFTEILQENELQGIIKGVTEDEEFELSVDYENENSEAILSLIEFIEESELEPQEDDEF